MVILFSCYLVLLRIVFLIKESIVTRSDLSLFFLSVIVPPVTNHIATYFENWSSLANGLFSSIRLLRVILYCGASPRIKAVVFFSFVDSTHFLQTFSTESWLIKVVHSLYSGLIISTASWSVIAPFLNCAIVVLHLL